MIHSTANGLVNFLEIESDDEADGTSTATELNLSEVDVKKLARFILEIVRDNVAGEGFWGDGLRQGANSDDTSRRARAAPSAAPRRPKRTSGY